MFFTHNVHVSVVHFLRLALRLMFSFTGSLSLLRFLASSLCRANCILVMTTGQLSCRTRQRTIFLNLARSASMFGNFFTKAYRSKTFRGLGNMNSIQFNSIQFIKIYKFAPCKVNYIIYYKNDYKLNMLTQDKMIYYNIVKITRTSILLFIKY